MQDDWCLSWVPDGTWHSLDTIVSFCGRVHTTMCVVFHCCGFESEEYVVHLLRRYYSRSNMNSQPMMDTALEQWQVCWMSPPWPEHFCWFRRPEFSNFYFKSPVVLGCIFLVFELFHLFFCCNVGGYCCFLHSILCREVVVGCCTWCGVLGINWWMLCWMCCCGYVFFSICWRFWDEHQVVASFVALLEENKEESDDENRREVWMISLAENNYYTLKKRWTCDCSKVSGGDAWSPHSYWYFHENPRFVTTPPVILWKVEKTTGWTVKWKLLNSSKGHDEQAWRSCNTEQRNKKYGYLVDEMMWHG